MLLNGVAATAANEEGLAAFQTGVPMLQIRDLRTNILKPASFFLSAGECIAVRGPSGAGKTLLLRAIADLDPNDGFVTLDGQTILLFLRSKTKMKTWTKRRMNTIKIRTERLKTISMIETEKRRAKNITATKRNAQERKRRDAIENENK
jgi:ABC-type glutathione transport system ATPase component